MADKIDVATINKFDGNNYPQWKFQVKCALKAKGIYGIVDGTVVKPEGNIQDTEIWNKKDALAMFTLTAAMDLGQITLVENCNTSMEILEKLNSVYQQKSEMSKMLVHERFHQYKMNPNDGVAQHVSKVENLAKQVKEAGETLSDAAIMTKILSTLPLKYRNLRQAWLSLDESKQTIPNLTARLLDEEANLTTYEETETALAAVSLKNKKTSYKNSKDVVCYNCRKKGHFAKHCRGPKRTSQPSEASTRVGSTSSTNNETAFNVEINQVTSDNDCWIMDSGASAHMTYRRDFFSTIEENCNLSVTLGNNQSLTVKGRGTVKIQKLIGGCWSNATINDVLYIPELRKNLFSEGAVASKGMKIVKVNNQADIFDKGKLVACAVRDTNNLYKMLFRTMSLNANAVSSDNLQMWHERLGHISIGSLRELVTKGQLVADINLNNMDNFFCEACVYGKQHKLPFKQNPHTKMKPGERIYSDLCGPMTTPSVSGSKYLLIFKDGCSGYRVAYFIKHKYDVLECLKTFNLKVKNKFGSAIKVLHTDNGTEYCNND